MRLVSRTFGEADSQGATNWSWVSPHVSYPGRAIK
jgi:hypothetical protein